LDNKLNKRERYKARLKPYDYFAEFQTLDFESLSEGDRFYLQDFGIFNTNFLEDEFTIRLRVPAGRISAQQFEYIAAIVKKYDLTSVLTARAGLQIHDIDSEDVAEIWQQLNEFGLTTWQSFGDNIRNIVTDVYDGVGEFNQVEVYPTIMKMQEFILKNPRYVGMLPRRVSIGISGNSANVSSFFANDIYFALAKKEEQYGFNVYMGGKNTEVAKSADIFLKIEEVFDFFKAFVETFYLHGSRYSRSRTRLIYLIEDIGMEGLKSLLSKEFGKEFENEGQLCLEKRTFLEHEKLKDGSYSFCYQSNFGRLDAQEMEQIASYASEHKAEIRLGIDQNIYLFGLKEPTNPFASPKQSATILACAGNLCPYAVWSIKEDTVYLPLKKINEHKIQVGFSGCAKGCGRHRHTDIGLIGLKTNNFGDTDGGARIFLGAGHTYGDSVGRMLFSMVPFVHLHKTVSLIIEIYEKSLCSDFEEFAHQVLNKYSEEFLSLWFLANLATEQSIKIPLIEKREDFIYERLLLQKTFVSFDFLDEMDEDFFKAISNLSKKLWTVAGEDPTYKAPIKRVNFR
jgi:ferredoxin-nitrite reductase